MKWTMPSIGLGLSVLLIGTVAVQAGPKQQFNLVVNRWLTVDQTIGKVQLIIQNRQQAAKVGDRLQNVGDGLITKARSTARIALDTGIGTVDVAADSQIVMQELTLNPHDRSRITRLQVSQGRVKLKLRKFTNPNSRLELETPAGISGVRGTEFGAVVQGSGKTSVAVLEGAVNTNAQQTDVLVPAGFQNFTIPGEPPSQPVPLSQDTSLRYQFERSIVGAQRRLTLVGQVDPVNQVEVDGHPQDTDRAGRFWVDLKLVSFPKVQVRVVTPLGEEKLHHLVFQ